MSFAKEGRETPQNANALACGILLAWAVMFVRVLVLVAVLLIQAEVVLMLIHLLFRD